MENKFSSSIHEDDNMNNIEECFDNNEESCGVYIIDDAYETMSMEKKKLLSQMQSSDHSHTILNELKNKNENKLNKLKLLLYQKFINFMFSILSLNLRKEFKLFLERTKFFKLKNMGYVIDKTNKKFKCPDFYVKTLVKQIERKEKREKIKESHENKKKFQQVEQQKKIRPSDHETEYKNYLEKVKLEKIKKEEKKKYEADLISKYKYADNIYKYLSIRKVFRNLILNLELNGVMKTFLENINKRIIKKIYIDKMKFVTDSIIQNRIKLDMIKFQTATNFYLFNLKFRILKLLYDNNHTNKNIQDYYIKKIFSVRKKIYLVKLFRIAKKIYYASINQSFMIIRRRDEIKRIYYSKILFRGLKLLIEEKKDQFLKKSLIEKLKSKAQNLLGENYII